MQTDRTWAGKGVNAMNDKFREYVESLHPSFQKLMSMPPVLVGDLPPGLPAEGVYLFSERERPLYAGRSNRIRQRLQEHCRPSSTHNIAPFAFLLAREATGKTRASYTPSGSRRELEADPVFREAFAQAKKRVAGMQVRYVEEPDSMRQALLEMYVAVALNTPYNSFETH